MHSPITALVLGAGRFGRHYAAILSELNGRRIRGIPEIERLIVTRTRLDRAEELAEGLRRSENCRITDIIGAEVGGRGQLAHLLEKYAPGFTAVAARDKNRGDTIHAHYAAEAVKYGVVLCEKPFCNARGDGLSLKHFSELRKGRYSDFFGLELPLAVVAGEMMKNTDLSDRLQHASRLKFYWSAHVSGRHDVVDDLALHPWSLIPPQFETWPVDVRDRGDQADIRIELRNPLNGQQMTCCILLRTGGRFRGMVVDDFGIRITSERESVKMIRLTGSLEDAVSGQDESPEENILLKVDNPLERHIVAALQRRPIVGLSRTRQSQLFLEKLRGYKGR
jgi:hypothetical protein